jgi:GTP 3',8-cyclase
MVLPLVDRFDRPLRSLRISVTDRCNLRCHYCMPEEEYAWLPRETLLSFEEITTLAGVFLGLGVDRVRITGGEPLLRRDLPALLRQLAALPALGDLALTTNGLLLAAQADALRQAGLHRITVSLDTLDPARFRTLTRVDAHAAVLAGIAAARRAGFTGIKIDTVVIRGTNEDELPDLLDFGRRHGLEVRFIEYMDVGGATRWSAEKVVPHDEIVERIERRHGRVSPVGGRGSAPADRFALADGTTFGIIGSMTRPFCADCDRSRLTADGMWLMCLYAHAGTDLRRPLRAGATPDELASLIRTVWSQRADRGAEERLGLDRRAPFVPLAALRRDAHLEMHTRGG